MPASAKFPAGWKFIIDPERKSYSINARLAPMKGAHGLKILAPSGREYYSVERAQNTGREKGALKDASADVFYEYIGAKKPRKRKPASRSADNAKKRSSPRAASPTDNIGARLQVRKSSKKPSRSANNVSKKRPSPSTGSHSPVKKHKGKSRGQRPRKQQSRVIAASDRSLVGKMFCFTWTDLENQRKVVYGKVVGANAYDFKVAYTSVSRERENFLSTSCASAIPESQLLQKPLVLGACIRYDQQINGTSDSALLKELGRQLLPWSWITPDSRSEELLENDDEDDSTRLPRLKIVVHGFELQLTVKPSSVPNITGNGVFLSCRSLMTDDEDSAEPFVLPAGALIDLGVYAPLRRQDRKLIAVCIAKNFMHSQKLEKWAFNAGDSLHQLDITDDVTGDAHALAMSHIYAYVNETKAEDDVCIRAEQDPEGSFHYLLGHAEKSQGDFVVQSGGSEQEVFLNYGTDYEKTRVRHGYGFLPREKNHWLEEIEKEDIEAVDTMNEFEAEEVTACVNFFSDLFSTEARFTKDVKQRALVCAVVLRRRARELLDEESNDDMSNKVVTRSKGLVTQLLDMVDDVEEELKDLHAAGNIDDVFRQVLEMQFSEEELENLSNMDGGSDSD